MSTITASTEDVIQLVKYAKLTAYPGKDDPIMSSIVLYTSKGQSGDAPGGHTLLVAVSSDGAAAGQYVIPVTGTLPAPVTIPSTDISWLATMLATDVRQHKDDDTSTQLDFDTASRTLKVRAIADGVEGPDDRRVVVGLDTSGGYPLDATMKLLESDPQETGTHSWVRAELPGSYLALLAAASKIAGAPVSMYPVSGSGSGIVAFLPRWRAAFPYGACLDYGDTVSHDEWGLASSADNI